MTKLYIKSSVAKLLYIKFYFVSEMATTGLRNDTYSDENFSDDESSPLTENIYGGR